MAHSPGDLAASAADFLMRILAGGPQYPAVALWRCWELALMRQYGLARPVLDLGCGNGGILDLLTDSGRELAGSGPVLGIDIVESFARLAAPRAVYEQVFVADARALPFATQTFAGTLSVCVLEHIPEVQAVLENVARVLRPGGRFLFSVPAPPLSRVAAEIHQPRGEEYVAEFNERVEHVNVWDAETWRARLGDAGLECAEVRGFMPRDAAREWFAAYDWTVRPIRGRGVVYRLAGPGLQRFGVGKALARYWFRRLKSAAETGVTAPLSEACALMIVAQRP